MLDEIQETNQLEGREQISLGRRVLGFLKIKKTPSNVSNLSASSDDSTPDEPSLQYFGPLLELS